MDTQIHRNAKRPHTLTQEQWLFTNGWHKNSDYLRMDGFPTSCHDEQCLCYGKPACQCLYMHLDLVACACIHAHVCISGKLTVVHANCTLHPTDLCRNVRLPNWESSAQCSILLSSTHDLVLTCTLQLSPSQSHYTIRCTVLLWYTAGHWENAHTDTRGITMQAWNTFPCALSTYCVLLLRPRISQPIVSAIFRCRC